MTSFELENSILSCMILDRKCSIEWNLLTKDDFLNEINRRVFEAIQNLVQSGRAVDYLMIYEELNKEVSITYLADLNNFMPTTANFKEYVKGLKDLTVKRQLAEPASKSKLLYNFFKMLYFDVLQSIHRLLILLESYPQAIGIKSPFCLICG